MEKTMCPGKKSQPHVWGTGGLAPSNTPTPPITHTLKLAGTFDISFNWRLKLPQVYDEPIWCCFLQRSLCQGLLSHLFKPTVQFRTTNERSFLFYNHSSSVNKTELSWFKNHIPIPALICWVMLCTSCTLQTALRGCSCLGSTYIMNAMMN